MFVPGPPAAPEIKEANPGMDKTLLFSWTAESSRTNQISSFTVTITVAGSEEEPFIVNNSSARSHVLKDYQGEKEYVIVVCAVNDNSMACSEPFKVPPTIFTPPPVIQTISLQPDSTGLSPGLIAGIVVIVVVAVLLCCLLLFLCLYYSTGWRAYYPGMHQGYSFPQIQDLVSVFSLSLQHNTCDVFQYF